MLLREALAITEDPERPFSIDYVSVDKTRRTGGEIIKLPAVVRVGASHNRKQNDTIVVKPTDRAEHPYTVHIHLITRINNIEVTY